MSTPTDTPFIHSMVITFSQDNQPLHALRTRTSNGANVADTISCSDLDAYIQTPVNHKPGCKAVIFTEEGPDFRNHPDVWNLLWDSLCIRLQMHALMRHSTCTKKQEALDPRLPDFYTPSGDKRRIVLSLPTDIPFSSVLINGTDLFKQMLEMGVPAELVAKTRAILSNQPPATFNKFYKDSDTPDDIDLPF